MSMVSTRRCMSMKILRQCILMMAHVHVYSWHGALLSSMKSVGEDLWHAVRREHVPCHFDVVALSMKMEHVDEDSSHSLEIIHVSCHFGVDSLPKWRKSVDDDPYDVRCH